MGMKTKNKQRKKVFNIIKTVLSSIAVIVLLAMIFAANTIVPQNGKMLNNILGVSRHVDNSKVADKKAKLQYYSQDYTKASIKKKERQLNDQIINEGTVLLKNTNNVMPYSKQTKFSIFSAGSIKRPSLLAKIMSGGKNANLKQVFEGNGFKINQQLWDFYDKGAGSKYGLGPGSISFGDAEDFSINEAPLSLLQKQAGLLDSAKGTKPVFVLSRVAGEGRDMARSMYNHTKIDQDKEKSYLEPDSVELEILEYLNSHYPDVVLLVNSNAALKLDWVAKFKNIHAVVFAPTIDRSLGAIFSGAANPSGKTVDTFTAHPENSPAAQNFGDYQYTDKAGKMTPYNYISYKEGIYVGYKYYETRYEDRLLAQGNPGDYNYDEEVVYPFGYGLSYTKFAWQNYQLNWQGDQGTATISVKNTGDCAGKDVVQLYAQSPYTDYDKQNLVEKSSVQLIGYAKTKELAPNERQTVTIKINEEQLKSYDAHGAKTYILDPGHYYITAAQDAHQAINNILVKKDQALKTKITGTANPDFVKEYTPKNTTVDTVKYQHDLRTGTSISNQFDAAAGDLKYLTRQDWVGTFPTNDGQPSKVISTWGNEINGKNSQGKPASYTWQKEVSPELLAKIKSSDSLSPIDKQSIKDKTVYSKKNNLYLIDLRGLDFDDPKWDQLLDELSPEDYQQLIVHSGYGIDAIKSINKPFSQDTDMAAGLSYGGTEKIYPNMIMLAQSWNHDLAKKYGNMIGNEALIGGADGWYAPSLNIHRTPFSGRNGEYYSEDPYLAGTIGQNVVRAAAAKGLYTYIKHFAVNDQENHRGDRQGQMGLVTWANEQSIRENYLKPFEMTVKTGNVDLKYYAQTANGQYVRKTKKIPATMALMTSFNRLGATWTGGSYPLITGVLRNEWGFKGMAITDNANTSKIMNEYQMVEAGADIKLLNAEDPTHFQFNKNSRAEYHYGRQAIHRVLYTVANSKNTNGAMSGSVFKSGLQKATKIQIGISVVAGLLIFVLVYFTIRRFKKAKD